MAALRGVSALPCPAVREDSCPFMYLWIYPKATTVRRSVLTLTTKPRQRATPMLTAHCNPRGARASPLLLLPYGCPASVPHPHRLPQRRLGRERRHLCLILRRRLHLRKCQPALQKFAASGDGPSSRGSFDVRVTPGSGLLLCANGSLHDQVRSLVRIHSFQARALVEDHVYQLRLGHGLSTPRASLSIQSDPGNLRVSTS